MNAKQYHRILKRRQARMQLEAELKLQREKKPGTYAANCLLARRLTERGVRFVQIYQRGWDVHGNLPEVLPSQCRDVDQAVIVDFGVDLNY